MAPTASDATPSDDRYRLLIDSVRDYAIFMLDPKGIITTWNQGAELITGYKGGDVLGRHFRLLYPEELRDTAAPDEELETATRTGRYEHEGWRSRKDNTRFWASIVVSRVLAPDGTLIGFTKIQRDLTTRREAEENLRRSEERFRLLVENVKDYAIFMLDANGNIRTWNAGAQRIKGYSADEVLGKHFSIFYPPSDIAAGKPQWELEVAQREGRVEDEGLRLKKDGSTFWADVVITALYDSQSKLYGYAKVTRDISDRKLLEEQRERLVREQALREEAERVNQAKDNFLLVLSHELRTPLTPILGWTKMLRKMDHQPQVSRALQVIERNAKLQTSIIEDLLDISRIVTGRITLERSTIGVAQLIESCVETVRAAAEDKRITITFVMESSVGPIPGDYTRLQQVLWNILNNAIRFTPPGGAIEIRLRKSGEEAEISIRDTGIGIGAENLKYIFDRFWQVDATPTRKHGGLGIGLSIARTLVELHGGTIAARSEGLGKGSTFIIRLPALRLPRQTGHYPLAPALAPDSSPLTGVKVLVVDDEADTLDMLRFMLMEFGAEVEAVSSAREALLQIDPFEPDVVVTDIGMPDEDGFWLMKRLKEIAPSMPVVALTAYARSEDRLRALSEGFGHHLAKPIEPKDLLSVVNSAIQGKHSA